MKSHIGETKRSKQGLTLVLKKWQSRERVQVEILETHERQYVTYRDFRKGLVYGNFLEYPPNGDVPLRYAIVFFIGIMSLILAAAGGVLYWLCK